jgi:hypothetical protein
MTRRAGESAPARPSLRGRSRAPGRTRRLPVCRTSTRAGPEPLRASIEPRSPPGVRPLARGRPRGRPQSGRWSGASSRASCDGRQNGIDCASDIGSSGRYRKRNRRAAERGSVNRDGSHKDRMHGADRRLHWAAVSSGATRPLRVLCASALRSRAGMRRRTCPRGIAGRPANGGASRRPLRPCPARFRPTAEICLREPQRVSGS